MNYTSKMEATLSRVHPEYHSSLSESGMSTLFSARNMDSHADDTRDVGDMISLMVCRTHTSGIYDLFFQAIDNEHPLYVSFPFSDNQNTGRHCHNYVELSFVVSGCMEVSFEDHVETFHSGELCLINHGVFHSDYLWHRDSIIIYLEIADKFFDDVFLADFTSHAAEAFIRDVIVQKKQDHKFVRFTSKLEEPEIPDLYHAIFRELLETRPGYRQLVKGYVERLLCCLPAEYQISLSKPERAKYMSHIFEDVKEYILRHHATVTTSELSRVFGYNRDYFNRLIRQHTGIGYGELLQQARLQEAARLLRRTEHTVEAISQQVGYTNLGYFYKAFRREYGMTPKEYRQHL